jgi:hypothetical protein
MISKNIGMSDRGGFQSLLLSHAEAKRDSLSADDEWNLGLHSGLSC